MNGHGHRSGRAGMLLGMALAMMGAVEARAQFSVLHLGTTKPVMDETGTNAVAGNAYVPGSLVQVAIAISAGPLPAAFLADGTLNTNVVLIDGGETRIGMLTSPRLERPGLFGKTFNNPIPASGSKLYVRVFNADNVMDATHYADSPLYTLSGSYLDVTLGAMTNALDISDDDGDGLHKRWERYYGSSDSNADSDGDDVSDYNEHRAGTNPVGPGSHLSLGKMKKQGGGMTLTWQSVPGRKYCVEFTDSLVEDEGEFYPLSGQIPATGPTTEYTVPSSYLDAATRQFRVVVIEK